MTQRRESIAGLALALGLSAGMKKRFDSGPQDWSERLKQLRQVREKAGQK